MTRPTMHPRIAALLLALAVGFTAYGRAQDAAGCVTMSDPTATLQQAANLVRAGVLPAAECRARDLVRTQPDSPDAHYLLGYILNRRGNANDSLSEYTKAAQLRTPRAVDLAVVALDYVILKDYPDAEKWITQSLLLEPTNSINWYYLGRIRYSYSAFDLARKAFEESLRLAPNNLRTLYNLGLTYEGLGNDDRAAEFYREAVAQERARHVEDAQPYYDLGSLLARKRKPADALPLLQQAAALDEKNPGIRERLAQVQEQLGDIAASKQNLEAAVALVPEVSSLHFELGRVDQKLHLAGEAKQQFDRCAILHTAKDSGDEQILNFTKAQ